LGELEIDRLLFLRHLNALDLVELLDPALYLRRLRRLIPEAVDECFEVMNPVLLILVLRLDLI